MVHGHLIAVKGAPILDWRGLGVIAFWAQDLRGSTYEDLFSWVPLPARKFPHPIVSDDEMAAEQSEVHRVRLQFSRGGCQVWQMMTEVKDEDVDRVFRYAPFQRAALSDPDDPLRVHGAARTLLNATRTHLSPQSRDELTFLAERLHHQIEARRW